MIDPQIRAAIDRLEAFMAPRSDAWNVPREEAMLLHAVALASRAKLLVEVGTSYGYSGVFLAAAARANGGTLHTIDVEPRKHAHARGVFEEAGLSETVILHTGDALDLLPDLPSGVEFVFLDSTKSLTLDFFRAVEPKLAPRAVVTLDNTHTHPDDLAPYLSMIRARADFTSCDCAVGHGIEISVRTGTA